MKQLSKENNYGRNYLKYKGFLSRIHFSEEDNVFFGKIEDIPHLISFEGDNEIELKQLSKKR